MTTELNYDFQSALTDHKSLPKHAFFLAGSAQKASSLSFQVIFKFLDLLYQKVDEGALSEDVLLEIENEIYIYDGLGHAFANPSNAGHDKEATQDAWEKTIDFLNKHLK